jgi:biofilm PGA synthesis lipoprotein PgaB
MRRTLVSYTDGVTDLIGLLRQPATYGGSLIPRERVVHVDLDYVYDKDTQKQEANLSTLIDRIVKLRPTTVYLQAYADPKGDGTVESVYFPNRHMPMRADLFSRAAWQLRSRAGVRVYAWMPVMAFKLPAENPAAAHVVQTMPGAPKKASEMRYHRLSPFDPLARKMINDIYEDLGKHAFFTGVLFHDDATLSDYEDASPQALRYYHEQWNLPDSLEAIRADPSAFERWSKEKTRFLNQFTVDLANTLRRYQPALLTARNLYAEPVLNPESEAWYAQSLPSFLEIYDFTAVMAMPYMERADEPTQWLARLIGQVAAIPDALPKTVFELQSRDWRTGEPVPTKTLAAQLRQLRVAGARNFGYYPDDFHNNEPDLATIMPEMSTRTAPDR